MSRTGDGVGLNICRVDWGLPSLQANVCVLGLPPGFPVVPQYLGHTSVVPQPLTEPDKQFSHIRLFTHTFREDQTGSCELGCEDGASQRAGGLVQNRPRYMTCVGYVGSAI